MWIRSQNKRILTNVNEALVTIIDENKCFISGFWGTGSDTLGVYSSKEKALRVLDKIQKYIGSERFYSTTKGISEQQSISSECTKVFQMPADEDVKI